MAKDKYTNKVLIRTVKDKKGHTIFESVESVKQFPKSQSAKRKVEWKLKLEELANAHKCSPWLCNEIFKILKQSKMKYKNYHWFISYTNINFKTSSETLKKDIQVLRAVLGDKILNLEEEQKIDVVRMLLDKTSVFVTSYPDKIDILGKEYVDWIFKQYPIFKQNCEKFLKLKQENKD